MPVLGNNDSGELCTLDFSDSSDDCNATSSCFESTPTLDALGYRVASLRSLIS